MCRLADFLVGPFLSVSWRMPAGVHGKGGFEARSGATRKLSSILVARVKSLRRMQEELHWDLRVPGSSPGRAFTGTVAQLAEHQAFLHKLSPWDREMQCFAANAEGTTSPQFESESLHYTGQ